MSFVKKKEKKNIYNFPQLLVLDKLTTARRKGDYLDKNLKSFWGMICTHLLHILW